MEKLLRDCELVITNFVHQISLVALENTPHPLNLPPHCSPPTPSPAPSTYCSPPPIKDNLPFHPPTPFIMNYDDLALYIQLPNLLGRWLRVRGLPSYHLSTRLSFWSRAYVMSPAKWKCYISASLGPTNIKLARWWLRFRGCHLLSHMSLWSCSHVVPLDKIKRLYLRFHKMCKRRYR